MGYRDEKIVSTNIFNFSLTRIKISFETYNTTDTEIFKILKRLVVINSPNDKMKRGQKLVLYNTK